MQNLSDYLVLELKAETYREMPIKKQKDMEMIEQKNLKMLM